MRCFTLPDAADALTVLGKVDELEVIRERADKRFGLVVLETANQSVEFGARLRVARAEILRECSRSFDLDKRVFAIRSAQDFTK